LSFALIPLVGIEGAAIGSAVAYTITNVGISVYLYRVSGLHPISWNYLIPVSITLVAFAVFAVLLGPSMSLSLSILFVFAAIVGLFHASIYLLTRSVNEGELEMIRAVLAELGVPSGPILRLLEWASGP
jgi:O-antigen/teichoic acid export membrane protein